MVPYFVIILTFLADRLSKSWAASYLAEHGPTRFNAFFTLTESYNQGIAFGMVQGIGRLVGWLTMAVVIGMLIYLSRLPRAEWITRLGLAFIIGGALGNLVDRVTAGEVLDFIQTPLRSGIFNVADAAINLGLVVMILGAFRHGRSAPGDTAKDGEEPRPDNSAL